MRIKLRSKKEKEEAIEKIFDDILDPETGLICPIKFQQKVKLESEKKPIDYLNGSGLCNYFELDLWTDEQALLILCGIDPIGAIIEYDVENFLGAPLDRVEILHAEFFEEKDTYDNPTKEELRDGINDAKEEINDINGVLSRAIDDCEIGVLTSRLDVKKNWLKICEEDMESERYHDIWAIRDYYSSQLSKFRRIWFSGEHEKRNSPPYYINWANNKGLEIPWLDWAREHNLLSLAHDKVGSRPTAQRDEEIQKAAELLAEEMKKDGCKTFTKRDIANNLSSGEEWKEFTAGRLEKILRKTW